MFVPTLSSSTSSLRSSLHRNTDIKKSDGGRSAIFTGGFGRNFGMVVVANHQAAHCLPVMGVARPCYLEFSLCFPYNTQSFTSRSDNF